ncbi:MAG: hypothetical protein ACLP0J_21360, partial [Solirubrobacteraceae bacterium]
MPRSRLLTFVTVALLATATAGASARAATINVTTSSDDTRAGDGICSLRKAIEAVDSPGTASSDCAAAAFGANTIVLPSGSFTLNPLNGELPVSSTVTALTIEGSGETVTIVSGDGGTRVLAVAAGASVLLEGVTITGGQAPGGTPGAGAAGAGGAGAAGANGGAILNAGNLTLADVEITSSRAGPGGAGASGGAG